MKNYNPDLLSASYNDIKDTEFDYAILPWGATEPHNYHLPYLTDCYLSHDISVDAAGKAYAIGKIKGMVLPPVPYGSQNPGQYDVPFCIHARYETQKAILGDVVASLTRQGINKLFIINGHGGNNFKNMVRDLAFDYPSFLIIISNWYDIIPRNGHFDKAGDHADELETSVLMHYRPHLVELTVAGDGAYQPFKTPSLNSGTGWTPRNWAKVSNDTGIGDPRESNVEKGVSYANMVTDKLAELFVEVVKGDMYLA